MPIRAGTIMKRTAFLLNDGTRTLYTDEVVLPYLQMAYDDLKLELEDNDVPITNVTSEPIAIPHGVKDIGGDTGPALPGNLIEIYSIWASSDDVNYRELRRISTLPKTEMSTSNLNVWSYEDQVVNFLPSNIDVKIRINYIGDTMGELDEATASIKINNCISFLQYRTAALCAEYIGENPTRAASLNTNCNRCIDIIVPINVKGNQGMVTRRRPFRAAWKSR